MKADLLLTTKNDKMKYKIQHVPKIKYSMSSN